MMLVEINCTVNKNGTLRIPRDILLDMGLEPGNHISLAYISNNGAKNSFQEFFVSAESVTNGQQIEKSQMITLPNELLEAAGISMESEVQIACADGVIVIFKTPGLKPEDLETILESLGVASESLKQLAMQEQVTPEMLTELESYI